MKDRYLTVTALTKYLKRKMELDPHLQEVWLKGEISNFNHHSRGHMYLTLKDDQSRIQAVMFAGSNRFLPFTPENGMNVIVKGEVSVFERYGQYQLYIDEMQPDGIGALYLAYEQLKEKYKKAGYFDQARKKAIPKYPTHIALITSPTGAAVRDMITTIKRRYPIVQLTVIPAIVQGESAPSSIQNAIISANKQDLFDTLIVGRGGGSIEDLWGYNDEKVIEAIFQSHIPVISGIGHETDTTISDYVADLRAPTPTGAAELAVPSLLELRDNLRHLSRSMTRLTQLNVMKKIESLQTLTKSYAFHIPKQLINEKEQQVDRLTDMMHHHLQRLVTEKQVGLTHQFTRLQNRHPKTKLQNMDEKLAAAKKSLSQNMEHKIERNRANFITAMDKLMLVNPLEIMRRGYAIPYDAEGHVIHTTANVSVNDQLIVRMADGSVHCQIQEVRRDTCDKEK